MSILSLAATCALTVWEAFALKVLWGWFVVTQFGLPPIGMAHAIGLSVLVGLVAHQAPSNVGEEDRLGQVIAWAAVAPAMALIVGWVAKQFL